ncbi:Agglutinin-like protein 1 precursor, partial [Scheffersomyces stipitis CBS 6054]
MLIVLAVAFLFSCVRAAVVSGVFTSFDSLVFQNGGNYPFDGPANPSWIATLKWQLDGTKVAPGDTFTLDMPCTFKFTQTPADAPVLLQAGGITYATCQTLGGEIIVPYSQLQCTVENAVTTSTLASGSVYFPVVFNIGGSATPVDLTDSKCFASGDNTVTFNDGDTKLSITANFETGYPASGVNPTNIIYRNRFLPQLGESQHLLVAGQCPRGYTSGTLGFSFSGGKLDCSSVHAAITNQLNDWYFPTDAETDFSFTYTCSASGYQITYKNIPAGYRPFIDGLTSATANLLTVSYTNKFVCVGSSINNDKSTKVTWSSYQNSDSGGDGHVIVLTTSTGTGSSTTVTTATGKSTNTIIVIVPTPTTTITQTYTGTVTTTTTVTATSGGTNTVIVEVPTSYPPNPTTTVTSTWTGTETSSTTVTDTHGGTDTIIVVVPSNPTTTLTSTWTGTETSSTTVTDTQGGTDTVIVVVP